MKKIERLYETVRRLNNEAVKCFEHYEAREHDINIAHSSGKAIAYGVVLTLIESLYNMESDDENG